MGQCSRTVGATARNFHFVPGDCELCAPSPRKATHFSLISSLQVGPRRSGRSVRPGRFYEVVLRKIAPHHRMFSCVPARPMEQDGFQPSAMSSIGGAPSRSGLVLRSLFSSVRSRPASSETGKAEQWSAAHYGSIPSRTRLNSPPGGIPGLKQMVRDTRSGPFSHRMESRWHG
jgi:hypothetical protein